jgi:hypothetical protein
VQMGRCLVVEWMSVSCTLPEEKQTISYELHGTGSEDLNTEQEDWACIYAFQQPIKTATFFKAWRNAKHQATETRRLILKLQLSNLFKRWIEQVDDIIIVDCYAIRRRSYNWRNYLLSTGRLIAMTGDRVKNGKYMAIGWDYLDILFRDQPEGGV